MKESLLKVIDMCGSQTALANAIGLRQPHVWNWLNRANGIVPAEHVIAVSKTVNYQVTPHQLRQDIYPNPHDGMPHSVCGCADQESAQ